MTPYVQNYKIINRYGELEDVEANLSSGVDANHQDAHGNTALHLSCANGHADVIRALIKAGASHLPNAAGNRCARAWVGGRLGEWSCGWSRLFSSSL